MLCNNKALSLQNGSYVKERRSLLLYTLLFISLGAVLRYFYKKSWNTEKSTKIVRFSSDESDAKRFHNRHSSSGAPTHRSRHSRSKKIVRSLPSIILLLGIHASGKSEWAKNYVERVCKTAIVIRSDDIRKSLTNSIQDHSRESEVEASILNELEEKIKQRETILIDDCEHNLSSEFRHKILDLVPPNTFNLVVKCFPLKPIFASERIKKDKKEGKKCYVPTDLELEDLASLYTEAEEAVRNEGWIEVKD